MEEMDPQALARALQEIPLFREVQRILASQSGPVNWEMARDLARAVAGAEGSGPSPSPEEEEDLREACRAAELRVAEVSGMDSPGIAEIAALSRTQWAEESLEAFRPYIDRLAGRLRGSMQGEATGLPMNAIVDALGPFLMGMQVGFLAGFLSRKVLGQYDVCFPAMKEGRIWFVFPNIVEVENELQVDPKQFRMWLALHEVTHHFEFRSVEWTAQHFVSLVERYIDAAEADPSEISERLGSLGDAESLARLMDHPEELLPLLITPVQQGIANEIQAFMSVLEGYAEWMMNEVGRGLLPEFEKMREGMNRRRAEQSVVERLLERLLGLDLKREQYRAGERFVRAVAEAGQIHLLWATPQNLPTLEEVSEPTRWLNRIAF